jgi:hypothetical protein
MFAERSGSPDIADGTFALDGTRKDGRPHKGIVSFPHYSKNIEGNIRTELMASGNCDFLLGKRGYRVVQVAHKGCNVAIVPEILRGTLR